MGEFSVLDHTADIGIVATGGTVREAFEAAAAGLFHLLADVRDLHPVVEFPVHLEGDDLEELLVRWLNHLIYLHEVEKVIFGRFRIFQLTATRLAAVVSGERIDPARHQLKTCVKAATYHGLTVVPPDPAAGPGSPAKVQVIFDV